MSHMSVNGIKKPPAYQPQPPKPHVPTGGQSTPNISDMYSQVAQQAMKTKPHHH